MPELERGRFPTTHWTFISRLRGEDPALAQRALEDLCAQYYYPLYCYIRRRGLDPADAEDALHNFLAKLLRLGTFAEAQAGKGHLRALLCASLRRFLANRSRDEAHRSREVSLDAGAAGLEAETRYRHERFVDHESPERLFERKWGYELMAQVLRRLRERYTSKGKGAIFEAFQPALLAGGSLRGLETPAIAASLTLSEGALRVAFHRFLSEFRAILEEEVYHTVSTREGVAGEIDYLLRLFQRK